MALGLGPWTAAVRSGSTGAVPHGRLSCPERWPRAAVLRPLTPAVTRRRPSLAPEVPTRWGREASVRGPLLCSEWLWTRVRPRGGRGQAPRADPPGSVLVADHRPDVRGDGPGPTGPPSIRTVSGVRKDSGRARRGWVCQLPRPQSPPARGHERPQQSSPGSPETRRPSTGSLGSWSRQTRCRSPTLGARSVCPPGLSPGSFTRPGPVLRPWVATSSQPGPLPSALPALCVLGGSGVGGAPWPLPMRGQKHCPRRDSRAPLRTHRACPAGRPAQVSIAIPPGPELLPGHMLLVPRLAVTRVFVGGWVPDPRSWLIGRRNCSGRWPGLSLH